MKQKISKNFLSRATITSKLEPSLRASRPKQPWHLYGIKKNTLLVNPEIQNLHQTPNILFKIYCYSSYNDATIYNLKFITMLYFNPIYTVFLESTPFPWHYVPPFYTFCVLKFTGLFYSRKQEKGLTVNYMHRNLLCRRTVTLVVNMSFFLTLESA